MYNLSSYLFVALLLCCTASRGQSFRVQGQVINEQKQPVEFMDTYLSNSTAAHSAHTYTDSLGHFSLRTSSGEYTLILSAYGKQKYSQVLKITQDLNLGTITIKEGVLLDAITLEAKEKRVEHKVDRLVFNVENSVLASGGDALSTLKVTPGIKVQQDKISMIGKSGMAVLINEVKLELSGDNLANYLRTIPSEQILRIEVITTPPAQYTAEGNSGLINIQLKKVKKESWNAMIGSHYMQSTYAGGSMLGGVNYNKKKWSLQASIHVGDLSRLMVDNSSFDYLTELWSKDSPRKIDNKYASLSAGVAYDINEKWSSGIQYWGTFDDIAIKQNAQTTIYDKKKETIGAQIGSKADWRIKPNRNSLNWRTIFQADTLGTKVTIDLDYLDYKSGEYRGYEGSEARISTPTNSERRFYGNNSNQTVSSNYTMKVEAVLPLSRGKLSFGGQVYRTTTNNSIAFLNSEEKESVMPPTQTNFFKFIENNQALYFSGNKELNEQWEMQVGLRMEATQTLGNSKEKASRDKNKYVQFFPTLYFSYTPTAHHVFALNYSRRINRPNYEQLNPFKIYSNPYSYGEGNPFLNPSYMDNIELSHMYKEVWMNKLYVSKLKDGFGQLKIIEEESKIEHYLPLNYFDMISIGLTQSYTFNQWNWWTSSLVLDGNYSKVTSLVDNTTKYQTGWNATITTNNDFILNNKNTLLFSLNYWWTFPGIADLYHISSSSSLNLGFKVLLLDKNMTISIQGTDIFSGERAQATGYFNQVKTTNRNYEDSRSFRFSLNYKFGNSQLKTTKRSVGNEAEQKRI